MSSDFKVQLCRNAPNATPEVFTVRRNWDLNQFKKRASTKLKFKVKRIFLANGSEVSGTDEMSANEILFASAGEDFYKVNSQQYALHHKFPSQQNLTQLQQQQQQQQHVVETFSVSVLGTGGVGKSAITMRFVRDIFIQDWDPTIEDAYKKSVNVDGVTCVIEVLDTAGQDDFLSLRPSWMIGKDGYVFVFSLDQPESVNELGPFVELHHQLNENRSVPIVLCGNKKDLIHTEGAEARFAKSRELAKIKAQELNATYIETSASSGDNVCLVFEGFAKEFLSMKKTEPRSKPPARCVLM